MFESMSCASYLMNMGVPPQALLKETASYDTIGNGYFAATVHALPRRWQSLCVITSEFHMPRSKAIFQTLSQLVETDFGWRCVISHVVRACVCHSLGCSPSAAVCETLKTHADSLRRFRWPWSARAVDANGMRLLHRIACPASTLCKSRCIWCGSDRVADSLTPACSIDLHFVEVSDDGIFEKDVLMARKEREQRSLDRFAEDMKDVSSLAAFSSWLHDTHLCYAVARQHEIGMSTGVSNKALASY